MIVKQNVNTHMTLALSLCGITHSIVLPCVIPDEEINYIFKIKLHMVS